MNYLYYCPECKDEKEVKKPMASAGTKEYCPDCGHKMKRKFTTPGVTWGANCWDYDNEGLGDNFVLKHHG